MAGQGTTGRREEPQKSSGHSAIKGKKKTKKEKNQGRPFVSHWGHV